MGLKDKTLYVSTTKRGLAISTTLAADCFGVRATFRLCHSMVWFSVCFAVFIAMGMDWVCGEEKG